MALDKNTLEVSSSIIKIVGVFESTPVKKTISGFKSIGYVAEELGERAKKFYKDYWYPEFRDLLFFNEKKTSAQILVKTLNQSITFKKDFDLKNQKDVLIDAEIGSLELILFPNGLHFFSIELKPVNQNIQQIADLIYCAREFNREVVGDASKSWVNWIETNCLNGIQITSNDVNKIVHTDGFSGSKFKLYTLVDFKEDESLKDTNVRDELLYDLGCVSAINTAGGDFSFTPSESYFEELLSDKISVFKNYTILPLFDTFTVVGYNLLSDDQYGTKRSSWTQTYFRIYLYNLFIKYNLFRYNMDMESDSVKVRDEFETFLNTYNISHISYNFLPNLIYHGLRKSLQIDNELKQFQERINRISQAIQEEQQKRSNMLLAVVGAMTSISSIEPVFGFMENTRNSLKWGKFGFYFLVSTLLISLAIPLVAYLFPDKKRKFLNKWKKRK